MRFSTLLGTQIIPSSGWTPGILYSNSLGSGYCLGLVTSPHKSPDQYTAEDLSGTLCTFLKHSLSAALFFLLLCLWALAALTCLTSQLHLLNSGILPGCTWVLCPCLWFWHSLQAVNWCKCWPTSFVSQVSENHCLSLSDVQNHYFTYCVYYFRFFFGRRVNIISIIPSFTEVDI